MLSDIELGVQWDCTGGGAYKLKGFVFEQCGSKRR